MVRQLYPSIIIKILHFLYCFQRRSCSPQCNPQVFNVKNNTIVELSIFPPEKFCVLDLNSTVYNVNRQTASTWVFMPRRECLSFCPNGWLDGKRSFRFANSLKHTLSLSLQKLQIEWDAIIKWSFLKNLRYLAFWLLSKMCHNFVFF